MARASYKTPLRYPGGKQKLTPFVLEVIQENDLEGCSYVEPYAGGGGVGLELLLDDHISHFHLNDSCNAIYSLWRALLRETEWFLRKLWDTPLNINIWKRQREIVSRQSEFSENEIGFATFYLNRCNRSGIIAGGGVIGGLAQTGKWKMNARFPKQELSRRIEAIAKRRRSISVTNHDAEVFIDRILPKLSQHRLVYFDPPYFRKAAALYFNAYKPADHERIAAAIRALPGKWMVSYDNTPEIRNLYAGCRQFAFPLQYNAAAAYKGREVFIFSDDMLIPKTSKLRTIRRCLWRVKLNH